MRLNNSLIWLSLLFLGLIFISQACNPKSTPVAHGKSLFQLAILDKEIRAFSNGLGQDWETAWPILQEAYPAKVEHTFIDDDFDNYDWSDQVITLTSRATESFLKDSKIILDGHSIDYLHGRAFVVAYENIPIYGGIFLPDFPFAEAYEYPVIYPDISDEQISFKIRPYRQVFKIDAKDPEWEKIKDKRIETLFDQLGKLIR